MGSGHSFQCSLIRRLLPSALPGTSPASPAWSSELYPLRLLPGGLSPIRSWGPEKPVHTQPTPTGVHRDFRASVDPSSVSKCLLSTHVALLALGMQRCRAWPREMDGHQSTMRACQVEVSLGYSGPAPPQAPPVGFFDPPELGTHHRCSNHVYRISEVAPQAGCTAPTWPPLCFYTPLPTCPSFLLFQQTQDLICVGVF